MDRDQFHRQGEGKDMRRHGRETTSARYQRPRGTSVVLFAALVLFAGLLSQCSGGGADLPGRIPINTATGWSDSPSISRDGQRLYFMYSRYDFGPWIKSGGTTTPVLSGPDRPGLHHSANPWDESDIYMAVKRSDGTWSEAVNLGLNGAYGDASGMEIDGGNTFIWLQGNGSGNDIVMASKAPDGTWNSPVSLGAGVNDHTGGVFQDNPHLSPDGQGLWFTSNRAGGAGARDIWFSLYTGGSWTTPVNMGSPFNTDGEEDQIWITPTGPTPEIYWNASDGLKRCTWNGSACSTPEIITIPGCSYAAEVSITDDGQYLYFGCGDLTTGRVKIMYSIKQPGGSWGQATPVD
jgi:hypothetical protein